MERLWRWREPKRREQEAGDIVGTGIVVWVVPREGGGLGHPSGSRRIKADLKTFLQGCGDICQGHADIAPSLQQAEGQIFC